MNCRICQSESTEFNYCQECYQVALKIAIDRTIGRSVAVVLRELETKKA